MKHLVSIRIPRTFLVSLFLLLATVLAGGLQNKPASLSELLAQDNSPVPLLEGDWYTYANSDDILVLELEGSVLWAGTRAGGVARWDTTTGTFVQFLKPQDGLAGNTVRDIYIDAGGHKWFATDHGLSILDDKGTADKSDDDWYNYTRATTDDNLPGNRVNAVAFDEDGYLWIASSQYWDNVEEAYVGGGLVKVDTKGNLDPSDDEWLQHYTVANTQSQNSTNIDLGLASDNVTDVLPVPGNRVWIATQRHWMFHPGAEDSPGEWLLGYGGLSRLDHQGTTGPTDDEWKTWNCEESSEFACIVYQLKLGPNGYVWAATRSRGVMAFSYDDPLLDYAQFRQSDGLQSDDAYAIAFGPQDDPQWQNTVWIGSYDSIAAVRGVSVLDHKGTVLNKDDDSWNERNPRPGQSITTEDGLPDDQVQAMAVGDDVIWFGLGGLWGVGHGISAFELARRSFQEHLLTADSTLPFNYVTDLAVGQEGTRWENHVWVGTGNKRERRYEYGLLEWETNGTADPADDAWTHFTKENTDDDGSEPWTGPASDSITALAIDDGNVWIGTQPVAWDSEIEDWTDGGFSVYDGEQWTTRTVENTGGESAGLRSNQISAIATGCNGEIWIGLGNLRDNNSLGLNVLEPGDPHDVSDDQWWEPIRYPTIPSDLVTGISTDCANNQLWISAAPSLRCTTSSNCLLTGGGAARYDYNTDTWTKWTAENGIESYRDSNVDGELMSVAVGPDGTAWVGAWGTRGMTRQQLIDGWPHVPAAISWFRDGAWSSHTFNNDGWISSIAMDSNGLVWAATSRGGLDINPPGGQEDDSLANPATGGIRVTVDGNEWTTWTPDNSPLVTTDIETITVDAGGGMWIGTNGWGIMHLHPPSESEVTPPPPTVTPPPYSEEPRTIHADAPSGLDALDCGTRALPCKSINYALRLAGNGGTVMVAEGTYPEAVLILRDVTLAGGYEANNWTRDVAQHGTTIDGGDQPVVIQVVDAKATIEGFIIQGGEIGIELDNAGTSVISQNTIRDVVGATGTKEDLAGDGIGIACSQSSPIIRENKLTAISGGDGGVWPDPSYVGTSGGNGYGIYCQEDSEAIVGDNELGAIRGGNGGRARYYGGFGGAAMGIACQDSRIRAVGNNISGVVGGLGASGDKGEDGGSATGISLDHCSTSSLMANRISVIRGAEGGFSYISSHYNQGSGGSATGIDVTSSTVSVINNSVTSVSGGHGSEHYREGPVPGGRGGQATGLFGHRGSSLRAINNTIGGLVGGDGGDGPESGWNRGDGGSAIGVVGQVSAITLTNNIIVSSTGGQGGSGSCNCQDGTGLGILSTGSSIHLTTNDVWDHSEANYSGIEPGETDISVNPLFAGPGHLAQGSPLIDAGTEAGVTNDIDGDIRPYDGDGDGIAKTDIGADEWVNGVSRRFYVPLIQR